MNIRASAVALLLAVVAVAPSANAAMEIRLTNNGIDTGWLTCGNLGITCTSVPGLNAITFNGTVGNYAINVSTGTQQTNGSHPFLDLNSSNTTAVTPPGQLIIETLFNGYAPASPGFGFVVNGNGGTGGTATFTAYGGNTNNTCAFGSTSCTPTSAGLATIGTTGAMPILLAPAGFTGSVFANIAAPTSPYSLAIVAQIDGAHAGGLSFDAALDPVPEPASVALLGGILLVSAGAIRRKMRRS